MNKPGVICTECIILNRRNEDLRKANDILRALNERVILLNNQLKAELAQIKKGKCTGWYAQFDRSQEERHA